MMMMTRLLSVAERAYAPIGAQLRKWARMGAYGGTVYEA
jgi:hypothetical protein